MQYIGMTKVAGGELNPFRTFHLPSRVKQEEAEVARRKGRNKEEASCFIQQQPKQEFDHHAMKLSHFNLK